MIFVDTGVWYAASLVEDPDHRVCREAMDSRRGRLITTDHVVAELLTLFSARGYRHLAIKLGVSLWSGSAATLVRVTEDDTTEAWRVFRTFTDKRWSFTDCTSYAVIERLGITEALSLDDHFRQFGTVKVLP